MMPGVRSVFDYVGTPEAGYNFQHAKCQQGPPNTCCDADSGCSPEDANVHRFMLPKPGVDNQQYRIRLVAPNVVCDRCTLQVTYRTGNSPDNYPETFWNCADVEMVDSNGTLPTNTPTAGVTKTPSINGATGTPIAKTSAPTSRPTSVPTTGRPTFDQKRPTRRPTRPPTGWPTRRSSSTIRPAKPPTTKQNICSATWTQCGGFGYTGPTCCTSLDDICVATNEYWSMCTPRSSIPGITSAPVTWAPTILGTGSCGSTWAQCGGVEFRGKTCCISANDVCEYHDQWYSQCQPKSG